MRPRPPKDSRFSLGIRGFLAKTATFEFADVLEDPSVEAVAEELIDTILRDSELYHDLASTSNRPRSAKPCGHSPALEKPQEFGRAVGEFLAQQGQSARR